MRTGLRSRRGREEGAGPQSAEVVGVSRAEGEGLAADSRA